jgi:hypothetical protein
VNFFEAMKNSLLENLAGRLFLCYLCFNNCHSQQKINRINIHTIRFYMRGYLLALSSEYRSKHEDLIDLKSCLADTDAPGEKCKPIQRVKYAKQKSILEKCHAGSKKRARAVEQVALFVALAFQTKIVKSLSDGA